ncbi:MAG TPA: hypothetical protein VGC07_07920 [Granulicella sp.]
MRSRLQNGVHNPERPLWLLWFTVFCILLIAVMSTVQLCHDHELDRLLGTKQGIPTSTTTDHCPLCVAMHSVLPSTLQTAPTPVMLVHTLDSVAADARRIFLWRFQLATRPPPAAIVCS